MRTRLAAANGVGGGGGGLQQQRPHQLAGSKRPADESNLNDDQRFTKRFNLLSLDHNNNNNNTSLPHGHSNLYIPVSSASTSTALPNGTHSAPTRPPWDYHQKTSHSEDEPMQLDDTRDRIYIHDLDRELTDISPTSSDEDSAPLIFLPDIDKRLTRIPQHILTGHTPEHHLQHHSGEHNELILYRDPKALSVDEPHDAVRKAFLETRQRAREREEAEREERRREEMKRKYGQQLEGEEGMETAHGYSSGYGKDNDIDEDAMDIG